MQKILKILLIVAAILLLALLVVTIDIGGYFNAFQGMFIATLLYPLIGIITTLVIIDSFRKARQGKILPVSRKLKATLFIVIIVTVLIMFVSLIMDSENDYHDPVPIIPASPSLNNYDNYPQESDHGMGILEEVS